MVEPIRKRIEDQIKESIVTVSEDRGELTVVVRTSDIARVCRFLRDDPELRFDSLRDICGVDYYRPEERFEVVYNLYSLAHKVRLRVKVRVEEDDLHVPTVTGVWPTADWHEREAYDMVGIRFDGHPDLRRIYMPEEFEYYPLRKDFPLMGIPGSLQLPSK